jgi:hypothetical protein
LVVAASRSESTGTHMLELPRLTRADILILTTHFGNWPWGIWELPHD